MAKYCIDFILLLILFFIYGTLAFISYFRINKFLVLLEPKNNKIKKVETNGYYLGLNIKTKV